MPAAELRKQQHSRKLLHCTALLAPFYRVPGFRCADPLHQPPTPQTALLLRHWYSNGRCLLLGMRSRRL